MFYVKIRAGTVDVIRFALQNELILQVEKPCVLSALKYI